MAHRSIDASVAQGRPIEVTIDRWDIRVPVIDIAAQRGVLVPPSDPEVLGWWRDGAEAGALRGGAVVTGHTVHTGGGALDGLDALRRGDKVRVRTARGRIDYAVRKVQIIKKAAFGDRAADIFSRSVPGRLVLITCTDWNGSEYLSNTVVFAEPVAVS